MVYFVLGAKWRDRINGNTYCNAKIYDANGSKIGYIGFAYGYDDHYMDIAYRWIAENAPKAPSKTIDLGCLEVTKKALKNNLF